jgi:23S rRNA A2030 N6-methylase RlmJ
MKNRVEGHTNLFKDDQTGVITNNNNSDRQRYQLAKKQAQKNMESQEEIKDLKEEINDIKSLLKQLINKK